VTWLAEGFAHPQRVELPTGHHLRPIREADVEIDYPAVMGSRDRLWQRYGASWSWPPATMTYDQDRDDLARHEAEARAQEAFNYAVLDGPERLLLGCVYIDPPEPGSPPGTDAAVSWWLVDDMADSELDRVLRSFVPEWLARTWGFARVQYSP
jgi:hypothetical protein